MVCAFSLPAHAEYPSQPITIIVPFPPGGASDKIARALDSHLGKNLGQRVLVEHVAGGAGVVGAMRLKRAEADGHTIMVGSIGVFATNVVLRNPPYDPLQDFDLLTLATREPNLLVVHPSVPATTVAELIAYLKQSPVKIGFADAGQGSSDQLTAALFLQSTGTAGRHVHYKGAGPATAALRAGETVAGFLNFNLALPEVRAGRLRAIAISSGARARMLPNVPTLNEAGIKDVEVYSWQGVAAPKGLPADVKARLHEALVAALRTPAVSNRLADAGLEIIGNSPDEFNDFVRDEIHRWRTVIKRAKLPPD